MLNQSKVSFDEEYHRYFLGHQELKGITGVLSRYLFPNKYSNVPARILNNARDRGHEIHKACELYNIFPTIYDDSLPELRMYVDLLSENNISPLKAEYTVSNNDTHATKIDMVDENFNLYDIKTTYTIDKKYLSWQLSVCAYLFELENPGVKAGKLYGIWLRDKASLVEVPRIDNEIVKSLLYADSIGAEWENPLKEEAIVFADSEALVMVETAIIELKMQIDECEAIKQRFVKELEDQMVQKGVSKWETENLRITRVAPTKTTTFDAKLFAEENPDLYKKYTKTSPRKGSIKIKLL